MKQAGPYISLYQPTHGQHPENKQDPILFRNLVKQIEESLRVQHTAEDVKKLLAPFNALASDVNFWNHTVDGVAVSCLGSHAACLYHVFGGDLSVLITVNYFGICKSN